jgi:hypothetical protein
MFTEPLRSSARCLESHRLATGNIVCVDAPSRLLSKVDWTELKQLSHLEEVLYGALYDHRKLYSAIQRQHLVVHFRVGHVANRYTPQH